MSKQRVYLSALAVALIVLAGAQWAVRAWADAATVDLARTLLPGFRPETPTYKRELVTYVILVLWIVGAVALAWFSRFLPKRAGRFRLPPLLLAGVALIGAAFAPYMLIKLIFVAAACASYLSDMADGKKPLLSARTSMHLLFAALVMAAVSFGLRAWYPVIVPNDYYELPDVVRVTSDTGVTTMPRAQAVLCLKERKPAAFEDVEEYIEKKQPAASDGRKRERKESDEEARTQRLARQGPMSAECRSVAAMSDAQVDRLYNAVASTEPWQSLTGRTLYHHSYVTVPARHFLDYGFDGEIPYLYGYGNTLVHSAVFAVMGPTWGAYFDTLPLFEYLGILVIGLVIWQITRSLAAGFAALGLALIYYYSITFVPILLAASFNPLRYLGLLAQVSAIAAVFRWQNPWGVFVIPLSIAFSCFWNTEYAIVGCIGQGLALLSPQINAALIRRLVALGIAMLIAAVFVLWKPLSPFITTTTNLGFFNIGLPGMSAPQSAALLAKLAFFCMILVLSSFIWFKGSERHIRFALIPVFALAWIKYYYNPSPPHLSFVYIFVAPLALCFAPWHLANRGRVMHIVAYSFVTATLLASVLGGMRYWQGALDARRQQNEFVVKPWSHLHDAVASPAPDAPIARRVASIRAHIAPDDRVVLLSPFDHVLSFYVSPRAYCGHFEMLTNVTSTTAVRAIQNCVQSSPNVLIVYDRALETPCHEDFLVAVPLCKDKFNVKSNLQRLMQRLGPDIRYVGSEGDLSFYRPAHATRSPVFKSSSAGEIAADPLGPAAR